MRVMLPLLLAFVFATAHAQEFNLGALTIYERWARPTPPGAATGAGYMVLTNTGDDADRLVGASSEVCDRVELHTHLMDNGVMRMRQVPSVELPPGESVAIAPGGLHLMLIGLKSPLEEGMSFPLTLMFEGGGSITVNVVVRHPEN